MNSGNTLKIILVLGLAVVGLIVAISLLKALVGVVLSLVIPVAVLGGILYVLYVVVGKKSLGGGGRSLP